MPHNLAAYMALQMKEIKEHKYYLSEKQRHDVGYAEAILDWTENHAERFHEVYFKHQDSIERRCKESCPEGCKGIDNCLLSMDEVHKMLED